MSSAIAPSIFPQDGIILRGVELSRLPVSNLTSEPIEVFFSYSHRDESLRDELAKHLSILKRQGVITDWHDRQISAGSEWKGAIDDHLHSAQIILLLISADFIASDYCYDIELRKALERHDCGETCVIPIILRPVDWNEAPFGKLQALPKNAKPITSWINQDEAFLNVAQGIRRTVKQLRTQQCKLKQLERLSIGGVLIANRLTWRYDRFLTPCYIQ